MSLRGIKQKFQFYLGTHIPSWLSQTTIPLFLSQRRLSARKTFPRATCLWALDSGGFSELALFGNWQTTPQKYVRDITRYEQEIGNLQWAAIQDWMCEPFIIAKTGLSVQIHQQRTIQSYLRLKDLLPEMRFVPVLQGWQPSDYERHIEGYLTAGVDLFKCPLVGLGSVCRRQRTRPVHELVHNLKKHGLKLHGFGVKIEGLRNMCDNLASADSMAWSFNARYDLPLSGHTHKNCANCQEYAVQWYEKAINTFTGPHQISLW